MIDEIGIKYNYRIEAAVNEFAEVRHILEVRKFIQKYINKGYNAETIKISLIDRTVYRER